MLKAFDLLALLVFCAVIYWLSDQSSLPVPELFTLQDKVQHFTAYFIMGVLAWRSFRHAVKPPLILAVLSVTFCSLYGISDEWHQSFVAGRSSDSLDWLADTAGAFVAMLFLTKFFQFQKQYR
ncbi:MAG: VanZ family protein [Methylococcaceae bacterium]|nr:VanZ family protein [Methylococcaceae bacterium]